MKRAAVLLLLVLCFVGPASARAQDAGEETLSLEFHLRATGKDEVVMCSDHDFSSSGEAYDFAQALAPELGFGRGSVTFNRADYNDCVRWAPFNGLTRPGAKPHQRVFHFDPTAVSAAAHDNFQLYYVGVDVCPPELHASVSPADFDHYDGNCDHPFQTAYSFFTGTDGTTPVIDVSFRATPSSLLLGLALVAGSWVVIIVLLVLLARLFGRRRWRFFTGKKSRFIAWTLNIVLMLALLFVVIFVAPYATGWIPSLQMYLHIGVFGEQILVGFPAMALALAMITGPVRQVRRLRTPPVPTGAPAPVPGAGVPHLSVPDWWGRQQGEAKPPDPPRRPN